MKAKILILSCLSLFGSVVFSQNSTENRKWYIPSYINVQYAGNLGMFSTSAGYFLYKDKLFLDIGYGYTPSSKAGIDIHNALIRFGYKPWKTELKFFNKEFFFRPFYFDLDITKQLNSRYTWSELPNYYPKKYYHQNAVRMHFDMGLSLQHNFSRYKLELYYLVTTNDVYLTYFNYYYHNHWLHFDKIFTQGLGFNFAF